MNEGSMRSGPCPNIETGGITIYIRASAPSTGLEDGRTCVLGGKQPPRRKGRINKAQRASGLESIR